MSSLNSLLFVFFAFLCSAVLCQHPEVKKGGHTAHFTHGPAYLSNLTKEERKEYFEIFRDKALTIKQQEEKKLAFAEKHGFGQMIRDDEKAKAESQTKIRKERPEIIKYLSEANEKLFQIYENKDLTVAQQQKAVEELKDKYPHAVPTLYYMSRLITGKGVHQKKSA